MKAYEIIKQKTGRDQVEYCSQVSDTEFVFGMSAESEGEEDIQILASDEGLYGVNVATQQVEEIYPPSFFSGQTKWSQGKEIDPEIFQAKQLFNL